MANALSVLETTEVVSKFLCENFNYWTREGKTPQEAVELAIKDTEGIATNPFTPNGEQLNEEAARETADIWQKLMRAKF